jgi:hypothetical protein
MEQFLAGRLSPQDFQATYIEKVKQETRTFPDDVFDVLDGLFAEVDAFCADKAQLVELERENPGYYLDEHVLRNRVATAREFLSVGVGTGAHPTKPLARSPGS